ncbi:hypothetical protein BZ21_3128 [Yersinia pseudotuberculosis]|nr:hypothetical protein BZ21_3128 [Yersinia pseudotuberculosis]AJJ68447.1 hypothetical protein BZ16_3241 [Yersinia pseudotuberculosis PB1/+]CQD59165.1 Uncharacterised protein [Yersinia intermedia]CFQ90525.1 Uncharacterised protein [Yersinia pseudotuberculosis]CND48535.1 Uncharacterised protein [Yersinia pseudotuberculosis]
MRQHTINKARSLAGFWVFDDDMTRYAPLKNSLQQNSQHTAQWLSSPP